MLDIESWIYRTFNDVVPYGQGTDLRVNCPFCPEGDEGHHLHISLVQETCHCFRCDYANSWLGLVADESGCGYSQARKEIEDGSGVIPLYKLIKQQGYNRIKAIANKDASLKSAFMTPYPRDERAEGMPSDFATINMALMDSSRFMRDSAHMACDYIAERMSVLRPYDELMKRYGDWWGIWRGMQGHGWLVIPVENGWWTSRWLLGWGYAKYISSPSSKDAVLYNYPALERYDHVAIAEGVFSAEFIGDNAVALCGKTATPMQLERLATSNVSHFEICLDAGTKKETLALSKALYRKGKKVSVRVYMHGDPADSQDYVVMPYSLRTEAQVSLGML